MNEKIKKEIDSAKNIKKSNEFNTDELKTDELDMVTGGFRLVRKPINKDMEKCTKK